MIIGVDFDNTIVSYDKIFHEYALKQSLIPSNLPINKTSVRDYLRSKGLEDIWTEMQGEVYGNRMLEAQMFSGVKESFRRAKILGHSIFIVSHKTQFPFKGPKYNLHESAMEWIKEVKLFDEETDDNLKNVFFEVTKEDKLNRIKYIGCQIFIDDLPEILTDPVFSSTTQKILFDPLYTYKNTVFDDITVKNSWHEVMTLY